MSGLAYRLMQRTARSPKALVALALGGCVVGLVLEAGLGSTLYAKSKPEASTESHTDVVVPSPATTGAAPIDLSAEAASLVVSGPAVEVPKEVLTLLDQRKHYLDRREEAIRVEARRLEELKQDIEQLLERYETAVKSEEKKQQAAQQAKDLQAKNKSEAEAAEQQAKMDAVTKIYETMPSEEAAMRIEKMPPEMAVKVLRSVKSKTAGAILAQVRPDKAAKLTERLVAPPKKKSAK